MKNVLLFICAIFLALCNISKSYGQDVGDLVRLKIQIPVKEVISIVKDGEVGKSFNVIGGNTKFVVLSKTETEVKLQAPNYKRISKKDSLNYLKNEGEPRTDLSEFYNEKIYTVSKSDFDLSAVSIADKSRVSVGLLTLPFKARPQDSFSFDTEFNLNTTLNITWLYSSNYSLNWQLGAGIGSVGLNTENSSGITEEQNQDVATLTFLTGLMVEHKGVQIGLYAGVDHINNQANYRWESNGNIWFAFGVGYNLFDIAKPSTANKHDN